MSQTTNFSPPQLGVLILAGMVFLLGIGVILLGPYLVGCLTYRPGGTQQQEDGRRLWAKIWLIDLIACILLFTARKYFFIDGFRQLYLPDF